MVGMMSSVTVWNQAKHPNRRHDGKGGDDPKLLQARSQPPTGVGSAVLFVAICVYDTGELRPAEEPSAHDDGETVPQSEGRADQQPKRLELGVRLSSIRETPAES